MPRWFSAILAGLPTTIFFVAPADAGQSMGELARANGDYVYSVPPNAPADVEQRVSACDAAVRLDLESRKLKMQPILLVVGIQACLRAQGIGIKVMTKDDPRFRRSKR